MDFKRYHYDTARILLDTIYTTAGSNPIITYSTIASQTNRHLFKEVPYDIGDLSIFCFDQLGLPMISAIVVNDTTQMPGQGFYALWKDLYGFSRENTFIFKSEMEKIIMCKDWYKLEDALNLKNKKFTKSYVPTIKASSSEIGKDYVFHDYDSDFKDISLEKKKRTERTKRHQALLRKIANVLEKNGYKLYEGIMDCAAVKHKEKTLLIEVKTLSGEGEDELHQVRKSLSQLLYYEEFHLSQIPNCSNSNVIKVVLFENKIQDKYISFLNKYGCRVLWGNENNELVGVDELLKSKNEI